MRGKVICLLYHRVDDTEKYLFLKKGGIPTIHPVELESDIYFLKARGAQFLTFKDLREGKFPGPDEIGVIVTFDDGFKDNYTIALDVLEKLDIRATIFQSTAMVDSVVLLWEHMLYWYIQDHHHQNVLKEELLSRKLADRTTLGAHEGFQLAKYLRENISAPVLAEVLNDILNANEQKAQQKIAEAIYPNSHELIKALQAGHEIGSHGHHHYKRENITSGQFETELVASIARLEKILPDRPACFSYPFNSYVSGDKNICRKYFDQTATVDGGYIDKKYDAFAIQRVTWPGEAKNMLRKRRWLTTGRI